MWGHFLWLENSEVWEEGMSVTPQRVGKHAPLQGPGPSSQKQGAPTYLSH